MPQGSYNGPQQATPTSTPVSRQKIEQIMADRPKAPGGKHRR